MRRTVPPSAEIEAQIDQLLAVGVGEDPRAALSQLAKLGARLIIQRAVEDEFDAWLGRARYERRPEYQRGLRNGFRARTLQTAEGELSVEIPQVREAAEPFVSKLFPRGTEAVAHRAVEGVGDRRVRARPVDARRRVAVRAGRAGEALEVDRVADLRGAARPLRAVQAPRSLRDPARRAVSRRDLSLPSGPAAPRRACWSPGASPTAGERVLLVGDAGDARVL